MRSCGRSIRAPGASETPVLGPSACGKHPDRQSANDAGSRPIGWLCSTGGSSRRVRRMGSETATSRSRFGNSRPDSGALAVSTTTRHASRNLSPAVRRRTKGTGRPAPSTPPHRLRFRAAPIDGESHRRSTPSERCLPRAYRRAAGCIVMHVAKSSSVSLSPLRSHASRPSPSGQIFCSRVTVDWGIARGRLKPGRKILRNVEKTHACRLLTHAGIREIGGRLA